MANKNCAPCSNGQNQYEADIYASITSWLKEVTCINWIQGYQAAGTPDTEEQSSGIKDQYGDVYIENIDEMEVINNGPIQIGESEVCIELEVRLSVTASLNVYNYSPTLNSGSLSPADILTRVRESYAIPALSDLMCSDYGISVMSWGSINNIAEDENAIYKRRSGRNVTFEVVRKTSYADTLIDGFNINLGGIDTRTYQTINSDGEIESVPLIGQIDDCVCPENNYKNITREN